MIEPAAAIRGAPVFGAVAPPCEEALRGRNEMSAHIDPIIAGLQPGEGGDFDGGVADDIQERFVAPDVTFQRCDVEIADDDGGGA